MTRRIKCPKCKSVGGDHSSIIVIYRRPPLVKCLACGHVWRTRAKYVDRLKDEVQT